MATKISVEFFFLFRFSEVHKLIRAPVSSSNDLRRRGSIILAHSRFSRILTPRILAICIFSTNDAKHCKYAS